MSDFAGADANSIPLPDEPPADGPADYSDEFGGYVGFNDDQGLRRASKGAWSKRNYGEGTSVAETGMRMPQNIDAEMSVLGAMIMSPDVVANVSELLTEDDFFRAQHQVIYRTVINMYAAGKEVDPVTLGARLSQDHLVEQAGGLPYLHTLVQKTPTVANAMYYAQLVKDQSTLRRLVYAGTRIVQFGYSGIEGEDIPAVVDAAQQEMFAVTNDSMREDYSVFADLVDETRAEIDALHQTGGKVKGVMTGFHDLDELTNGLHGGQMIIVAARPGIGKSTLAMDILRHAAIEQRKTAALFSLEMSKVEVMMRVLSAETTIPLQRIRSGSMNDRDWSNLARRMGEIHDRPLFIDDSPNMTMLEIRSKARRLKQQFDLGILAIDYLQLMSSGKKVESRQQEVSEFSRQIKLLAKELDIPIIAISQLNRGVESRGEDAKPRISDLRESGSLEQDADIVILISRPQDPDHERAGMADLIVAKHRGGPIRDIEVSSTLQYCRFTNKAEDRAPAGPGGPGVPHPAGPGSVPHPAGPGSVARPPIGPGGPGAPGAAPGGGGPAAGPGGFDVPPEDDNLGMPPA